MNWWILVAMMLVAIAAVTWAAQAETSTQPPSKALDEEGSNDDVSQ